MAAAVIDTVGYLHFVTPIEIVEWCQGTFRAVSANLVMGSARTPITRLV